MRRVRLTGKEVSRNKISQFRDAFPGIRRFGKGLADDRDGLGDETAVGVPADIGWIEEFGFEQGIPSYLTFAQSEHKCDDTAADEDDANG
ncbi:MAG TPA: hypothetical protein VE866_15340, partial [Candidatus Binatia bacterium]|nr:hypothetical protein [Candidatus Binatia bacterium]